MSLGCTSVRRKNTLPLTFLRGAEWLRLSTGRQSDGRAFPPPPLSLPQPRDGEAQGKAHPWSVLTPSVCSSRPPFVCPARCRPIWTPWPSAFLLDLVLGSPAEDGRRLRVGNSSLRGSLPAGPPVEQCFPGRFSRSLLPFPWPLRGHGTRFRLLPWSLHSNPDTRNRNHRLQRLFWSVVLST